MKTAARERPLSGGVTRPDFRPHPPRPLILRSLQIVTGLQIEPVIKSPPASGIRRERKPPQSHGSILTNSIASAASRRSQPPFPFAPYRSHPLGRSVPQLRVIAVLPGAGGGLKRLDLPQPRQLLFRRGGQKRAPLPPPGQLVDVPYQSFGEYNMRPLAGYMCAAHPTTSLTSCGLLTLRMGHHALVNSFPFPPAPGCAPIRAGESGGQLRPATTANTARATARAGTTTCPPLVCGLDPARSAGTHPFSKA